MKYCIERAKRKGVTWYLFSYPPDDVLKWTTEIEKAVFFDERVDACDVRDMLWRQYLVDRDECFVLGTADRKSNRFEDYERAMGVVK